MGLDVENDLHLVPVGRLVDSVAPLMFRPDRFENRLGFYEMLHATRPRYVHVSQIIDPSSGKYLTGIFGDPIFLVVLEDREDTGPKVHTFTNADPHGGEFQGEDATRARTLFAMDNPETLRGQCQWFLFAGSDSRHYHDTVVLPELYADHAMVEDRSEHGARLQLMQYVSGWTDGEVNSPGWLGLELSLGMLRDRLDERKEDFFATFVSAHNSQIARDPYALVGARSKPKMRLHAGAINGYMSALGVELKGWPIDHGRPRPIEGTPGIFPIHLRESLPKSGSKTGTSDCKLVTDMFTGRVPVMVTFEGPDNLLVFKQLSLSDQRKLTQKFIAHGVKMALLLIRLGLCAQEVGHKHTNIYLDHLKSYATPEGNPLKVHPLKVSGDDTSQALTRVVTRCMWIYRDSLAANPVFGPDIVWTSGAGTRAGNTLLEMDQARVELFRKFNDVGHIRRLPLSVTTATQLAATQVAYLSSLGAADSRYLTFPESGFADLIRNSYDDGLSSKAFESQALAHAGFVL